MSAVDRLKISHIEPLMPHAINLLNYLYFTQMFRSFSYDNQTAEKRVKKIFIVFAYLAMRWMLKGICNWVKKLKILEFSIQLINI